MIHTSYICAPLHYSFRKVVAYVVFFKCEMDFLTNLSSPAAQQAHTFLAVAAQTLQLTLKL